MCRHSIDRRSDEVVMYQATLNHDAIKTIPTLLPMPSFFRTGRFLFDPRCGCYGRQRLNAARAARGGRGEKTAAAGTGPQMRFDFKWNSPLGSAGPWLRYFGRIEIQNCSCAAEVAVRIPGLVEAVMDQVIMKIL